MLLPDASSVEPRELRDPACPIWTGAALLCGIAGVVVGLLIAVALLVLNSLETVT